MQRPAPDHAVAREKIISEHICDVAADLRLVDATDYIAYFRLGYLANVADIVRSSAALYFRDQTLKLGGGGDVLVTWGRPPTILLELEFCNAGVSAHFVLRLEDDHAGVQLNFISFNDPDPDPVRNTERLGEALFAARLRPVQAAAA